jgi:hypothetical protein
LDRGRNLSDKRFSLATELQTHGTAMLNRSTLGDPALSENSPASIGLSDLRNRLELVAGTTV